MKKPDKHEIQWASDIVEFINGVGLGVLYPGYESRLDYHLHHVTGRASKQNKIHIGHWFILPVPIELHDVHSNHPFNVTHHKKLFCERYGQQSDLFIELVEMMADDMYETPPKEVLNAIMDTRA